MNKSKIALFLPILVVFLFVTACSGTSAGSWPGLTITKDTAFISDAANIYAIKLSDGSLAWPKAAQPTSGQVYYAPPVLSQDGKQLIVGDYGTTLSSLDPSNGNVVWSFKDGKSHWIGSPLVASAAIYAPNADDNLYALDLQGNLKWKFNTKAALWAQPVMDGNVIYQASMDHNLYAIQAQTGTQIWSVNLGSALIVSPLLDTNGILYIGSLGNEVLAVQASNGQILWRASTTGPVWSQLVLSNGNLYLGDLSGAIYAISTDGGKILWQQKPGGVITGSLAVIPNGLVYGTDAGVLAAIDLKGNQLWSKTFNGKLYTSPVFQTDRIYIAITGSTDSTLLVALDADGNQKWSFIPPK